MDKWFRDLREDELQTELEQGDVIESVIHLVPPSDGTWTASDDEAPDIELEKALGIVLTQSCDMAQVQGEGRADNVGSRAPNVAVCRVFSLSEMSKVNEQFAQDAHLETIRKGNQRAYHMLYGEVDPLLPEKYYFVSLREMCFIPLVHLERHIEKGAQRTRMISPLREALAFAFARSFDRVALDRRYEIPPFIEQRSAFRRAEGLFKTLTSDQKTAFIDTYSVHGFWKRKDDPSLVKAAMEEGLSVKDYLAKVREDARS